MKTITLRLSHDALETLRALVEGAIDAGADEYDPGLTQLEESLTECLPTAIWSPADDSRNPWVVAGN